MLSQGLEYLDFNGRSSERERRRVAAWAFGQGRLACLAARVRSQSLDRALIAGADPGSSAALAARAAMLTSPRSRAQIAEALEHLVCAAHAPRRRWWAVSPNGPVPANAEAIRELAALLRRDTPLYARGIAVLSQLLTDGCGPVYDGSEESLARELRHAHASVVGG
jgi:hypothetical protein